MKPLSKVEQKELAAAVREVYEELAKRPFHRECTRTTTCCQFSVTREIPKLTLCEAFVAAKTYRATGRKALPQSKDCPLFDAAKKKCLIYEGRPFGCRTHFCEAAGGPCERREVADLIRKLEFLDTQFFQFPKGGISLPQAVKIFL